MSNAGDSTAGKQPQQEEGSPSSPPLPPQQTPFQRWFTRLLRATFAFVVLMLPMLSFGLTCSTITSRDWYTTGDSNSWKAASPASGCCSCFTTHTDYCRETSDAFEGTSYLGLVIIGSQFIAIGILLLELAMYGLFGGSHSFTRLVLIISLVSLATQMLSVISWFATYANQHCGDPSFQDRGASLSWAIILRILEMVATAAYVFYTIALFSKPNRGPPSLPALSIMFFIAFSCITSFSGSWMSFNNQVYGTWSRCSCDDCGGESRFTVLFAMSILAAISGFVTLFFTVLRAVDNEGATLKFASGASALTLIFQIVIVVVAINLFGDEAALKGVSYEMGWPVFCTFAALGCQLFFLILNSIYMAPACCAPVSTDPSMADRSVFQTFWWDQLKDARRLAHEARDEEDLEDDDDSDDDEDDDQDVAAATTSKNDDDDGKSKSKEGEEGSSDFRGNAARDDEDDDSSRKR